jgi:hypothetical protein
MGKIIQFPIKKKAEAKVEPPEYLKKIRNSLDRINQLMLELKKIAEKDSKNIGSNKK